MRKTWAMAMAAAAALAGPAGGSRAAEVVPMYNFSLIGGQYFFAGSETHLNANAAMNVAPAVKLDNGWSVLPLYNGYYRGTKSVTDAVGAGTLFQQEMSHRISVSGLHSIPGTEWRVKPSVSYKYDFLKETRDEAWGKGLFDYQKAGVGFEGERVYRDPFSVRFAYDFYYINFPHFVSLESKSGVDPSGNPLGRETAGSHVLDTINNQFTVTATRPYPYDDPKVSLQGSYSLLWQKFADEPLVDQAGQYLSAGRQDFNQCLNFSLVYPRSLADDLYRLTSSAQMGFVYNGSNQNTYDAGQLQYVSDAYSYYSVFVGPAFNLSWGDKKMPQTVGLSFLYSLTQYTGRLTQDPNGLYGDSHQEHNRYLLTTGYSYPIAEHFRLSANANFLWTTSNMSYEKTYQYTYNAASYLLGFVYDY